jgi:polysaccharide biosynthesis protein PslG
MRAFITLIVILLVPASASALAPMGYNDAFTAESVKSRQAHNTLQADNIRLQQAQQKLADLNQLLSHKEDMYKEASKEVIAAAIMVNYQKEAIQAIEQRLARINSQIKLVQQELLKAPKAKKPALRSKLTKLYNTRKQVLAELEAANTKLKSLENTLYQKKILQAIASQGTDSVRALRDSAKEDYEAKKIQRDNQANVAAYLAYLDRVQKQQMITESLNSGAKVNRLIVSWAQVQAGGPSSWDWRYYDTIYNMQLSRGVKPLIVITSGPCWSAPSFKECKNHARPDKQYYPHFREFTKRVLKRYPQAFGLEVWNEPNLHHFWGPNPNPAAYVNILKEAYLAKQAVKSSVKISIAGTAPALGAINSAGPFMHWEEWLRKAYKNGAAKYADALSIHPYPTDSPPTAASVISKYDRAKAFQKQFNHKGPIWVTEVGFTTNQAATNSVTLQEQANRTQAMYQQLSNRGAGVVILHRLRDTKNPNPWEAGLGLMHENGSPKPAYCMLRKLGKVTTPVQGC